VLQAKASPRPWLTHRIADHVLLLGRHEDYLGRFEPNQVSNVPTQANAALAVLAVNEFAALVDDADEQDRLFEIGLRDGSVLRAVAGSPLYNAHLVRRALLARIRDQAQEALRHE